jgi:predicted RNA binding protein YcfA (HicA-like mRNA interferase family)
MPRKIRELISDYRRAGAKIDRSGGKGSHRKVRHPKFAGVVIVSGRDGDDVRRYQERDLQEFLRRIGG